MAEIIKNTRRFIAGEAVSKGNVVTAGTTARYILQGDDNDQAIGVAQYGAASGADVEVIESGKVEVVASGAINRLTGANLTKVVAAADGKVKALATTTAGTYEILGEVDNDQATVSDGQKLYINIKPESYCVVAD